MAGERGFAIDATRVYRIQLSDPQNIPMCVQEMEQKLNDLVAGSSSPNGDPLIVDVTGGTKPMSAALMLVARRWDCQFRYVGGTQRSKAGLGIVATGSEFLSECRNPMDELGYAAVEDALSLSASASYSAASDILRHARNRISNAEVKRSLLALECLTSFFAMRDRFRFRKASEKLHSLRKHRESLATVLDQTSVDSVFELAQAWKAQLEELRQNRVSEALISELLANANRRFREGRYDDGVARLYRAAEAIAQFVLARKYGIEYTSRVTLENVPEAVREEYRSRLREDLTFKLALQEDYRLLQQFGDPLAHRFFELGLDDRKKSPLETRNQSILAHGFQAVTPEALRLRDDVMKLAEVIEIGEADLPKFPELRGRGTSVSLHRSDNSRSSC